MTFEDVKKIRENPSMDDVDNKELSQMIDIAIERQIPKKCEGFKSVCDCGYMVFPHMKFCSQCGKALDWSDTE